SQPQLLPGSPLPAPSPYPAQTGSLAERREPESRHASYVRNFIRARRSRPPTIPGTHTIALRPSTVPQRIALPSPPASSLPDVPDPQSDLAHAASPTSASALVTELVDFAATRLSTTSRFLLLSPYDDEVPPHGANIVDGMRIFRVNRPPGGRLLRLMHAALGFTPSSADLSLFMRTDPTLPPFYILVYVDDLVFVTADTEALTLVKAELLKRHTCFDLDELRSYLGLQITRDRALRTMTLTQSHMVHHVLQLFSFQFSSP
ncbi:unnamed protein product, partial [Closterium sp. NIES-53]